MTFTSYASSSAGNAYAISDGKTSILLECGLPYRKLKEKAGFALYQFSACLLTHSHKDHSKCAAELIRDGMKLYTSEGTANELQLMGAEIISDREQFNVGTLDVVAFATFHDCAEPLGFLIRSRIDGDVLVFATDTVNLRYRFPGVSIMAIEANYDKDLLEKSTRLPDKVRQRISNTHMEISTLCDYLSSLDLSECREIQLLHLSDSQSREADFIFRVKMAAPKGIKVTACKK